jgi:DNA polymerase III subunit chi
LARVDFYHLTVAPVEQLLPKIAGRVLAGGGRLLIVAEATDLTERISQALWTQDRTSFLAHGLAGAAGAADQPIVFATTCEAANAADAVALADGRWRKDALGFARTFYCFTPDLVDSARTAWRDLAEQACERHYWRQDGSRWREGP